MCICKECLVFNGINIRVSAQRIFNVYYLLNEEGSQHNAFVFGLKPADGVFLRDTVLQSDLAWLDLSSRYTVSRSNEDYVEVHTEDTSGRIVFETQIDVFSDAEAKASRVREVFLL